MKQKVTNKKNYLGKMPSVKSFIKEHQADWWIIGIFLMIVYGIKVFNISLSHDTEAIISVPENLYGGWLMLGRFGLILLKKVLGTYVFNPYVAAFLMVLSMLVNSILWIYLFEWIGKIRKSTVPVAWIFPTFFFTSMIMAEQEGFLLQAYEVNVGLLLIGIAFLCLFKIYVGDGSKVLYIPAVLCCVIAYSAYQSFVPLFTAGAAICFIILYDRLLVEKREEVTFKNCFVLIGKMIVFFLITFLVSQIANKVVQIVLNVESTTYLTGQIMWGTLSFKECIYNITRHIYRALFGKRIFYNGFNLVLYAVVCGYVVLRIRKKNPCYVLYAAAVLYCLISPFMMTILMGNEPMARTQLLLPFVGGFLLWYLMEKLWKSELQKYVGALALVVCCVVAMNQSMASARLYYTQYMQYEEDLRVAEKITDRIEQLNLGEIPEIPVVFVGSRTPLVKPSCVESVQLELIGKSFFEVSFGTTHGTWIMRNFLMTQGYEYVLPTSEETTKAEKAAKDMPSWPDTGSVAEKDGVVIVKLGE